MIEGWGDNFEQKNYINALKFGTHQAFDVVKKIQSKKQEKKSSLSKSSNNKEGSEASVSEWTPAFDKINFVQLKFQELGYSKIYDILTNSMYDKQSRDEAISQVKNSILNSLLKNELKSDSNTFTYNYLSELFTRVTLFP